MDFESVYIPQYFSASRQQRHLTVRQGIKIVLLQEGSIGRFQLQALLLTLVTGMGLLASAGVAVDAVALHLMPRRGQYYHHKYEVTERLRSATRGGVAAGAAARAAADGAGGLYQPLSGGGSLNDGSENEAVLGV